MAFDNLTDDEIRGIIALKRGNYSVREIEDECEAHGVPAKRSQIQRILRPETDEQQERVNQALHNQDNSVPVPTLRIAREEITSSIGKLRENLTLLNGLNRQPSPQPRTDQTTAPARKFHECTACGPDKYGQPIYHDTTDWPCKNWKRKLAAIAANR
jgi:hypothetical protein